MADDESTSCPPTRFPALENRIKALHAKLADRSRGLPPVVNREASPPAPKAYMRLEVPYHTVSPSRRPTAFPQLEADIEALRARTWARAQALPTFPHATAHEEASTARATPIKRSRKAAPLPPLKWYQGQNLVAIGVLVVVVYVLATSLVAHYQWFFS